jgi:hypothetical protein
MKQPPKKVAKKPSNKKKTQFKRTEFTLSDYQAINYFFRLGIPEIIQANSIEECGKELRAKQLIEFDLLFYPKIFEKLGINDTRTEEEISGGLKAPKEVIDEFIKSVEQDKDKYPSDFAGEEVSLREAIKIQLLKRFDTNIPECKKHTLVDSIEMAIYTRMMFIILEIIEPLLSPTYDLHQRHNIPFSKDTISYEQGFKQFPDKYYKFISGARDRDTTGGGYSHREDFNQKMYEIDKQTAFELTPLKLLSKTLAISSNLLIVRDKKHPKKEISEIPPHCKNDFSDITIKTDNVRKLLSSYARYKKRLHVSRNV